MSRRGRGYGGRSKAGTARIGGVEISYDDGLEESMKNRVQPVALFPEYTPAQPRPLSKVESDRVTKFLDIRRRFREGPLFTVLAQNDKGSDFNPFEGMQAYSQKYVKRARHLPDLKLQPRVLRLTPRELWSVYESGSAKVNGAKARAAEQRPQKKHETNLDAIEDDDEAADNPDDAEVPEEEMDDEFETDEDEMAGDYNAEQYFDDGGDDAGDDYDAGDGDGGEAFG